ncbi:hypothetical protein [Actinomyces urinae]|uniref:hypothetical protein n=1 Tax=Actinomyces urinae TaxID=1689268 RepID=UPI0009309EB4|nr:hypothetical protein [Actinomyces urinae]
MNTILSFIYLWLADEESERGDVPGWVLVTLMTAGLVTAIWAIASPTLSNLFQTAIAGVTGP